MRLISVSAGNVYCANFAVSLSGFPGYAGAALILPSDNTIFHDEVTTGHIVSGRDTVQGDRFCDHLHLEGDAVRTKNGLYSMSMKDYSSIGIEKPLSVLKMPGSSRYLNGEVGWNHVPNTYVNIPYSKVGKTTYMNWNLHCRQEGNYVYWHLEYQWTNDGSPLVHESAVDRSWELDIPGKRYRSTLDSTWTKMSLYAAGTLPSGYVLPHSKEEYERFWRSENRGFSSPPSHFVHSDLIRRCANDAQVTNVNSLELVKELREISSTLRGLYNLSKGKIDAKKMASVYLSYKYGVRLTAKDLISLRSDFSRQISLQDRAVRRVRAMERIFTPSALDPTHLKESVYVHKVTYSPNSSDWRGFVQSWFDTGLFPSLTNAWDLIPLSFVMDWFANIESHLDAIDANTYWSLLSVLGVTYSTKHTIPDVLQRNSSAAGSLSGHTSLVSYTRHVSRTLGKPSFFELTPHEFRNYAELTALVVANWK